MKVARYAVAGTLAGTVDFLLFALFARVLGYDYLVVGALTFSLATVINYLLCVRFVFKSGTRFAPRAEFVMVFGVSIIGLLLNQLALYAGIELFGGDMLVTKLGANLVSFCWNYLARKHIVFPER